MPSILSERERGREGDYADWPVNPGESPVPIFSVLRLQG